MLCFTFWGTLFVLPTAALVCVHVPLVENDTPFAQVIFWWGPFVKYNFGRLLRERDLDQQPPLQLGKQRNNYFKTINIHPRLN
jgi:hypothetical protein